MAPPTARGARTASVLAPPAVLAAMMLGSACTPLPPPGPQRGLYGDLRKTVELSEDTGWFIDRLQLDTNLETALRSVCQVPASQRAALVSWLADRVEDEGGPARIQYLENGRSLDGLDGVLTLERIRALLARAGDVAADDCPFWLEPDPAFTGVEGNDGRTTLLLESQGFGAVLAKGNERALSGGGGLRIMVSRGLSPHLSVAAGGEVGGSGTLNPGSEADQLDSSIHAAIPVSLRVTRFSRVLDFQVAPVFRFNQGEEPFPPGVRASVGAGFATMRKGAFMPFVVVWLGYESFGLFDDSLLTHSFRVGTRVGVDWDPGL